MSAPAVTLGDYEAKARETLDANAWAYFAGGAADELAKHGGEAVFDHPLDEALGKDRHLVGDAGELVQPGDVGRRGHLRDGDDRFRGGMRVERFEGHRRPDRQERTA